MAISAVRNHGKTTYGVTEYYLDDEADVSGLPTNEEVGSIATVLTTGAIYKINSVGQWLKQPSPSGSSGSTTIIGSLPVDNASIVFLNNSISIKDFSNAGIGTVPTKTADGILEWLPSNNSTIIGSIPSTSTATTIIGYIDEQINKTVQGISINGTTIRATDGVLTFPVATNDGYGLIKGSNKENSISILEDGTAEINSLNIERIVQEEGNEMLLTCGNSNF